MVLTTIDASSGAMWAWKVDGGNGALDWERAPVPGTDSDQDAPRLKLPGQSSSSLMRMLNPRSSSRCHRPERPNFGEWSALRGHGADLDDGGVFLPSAKRVC